MPLYTLVPKLISFVRPLVLEIFLSKGHEHLEKHVNKLLELTKLAVKELLTPKGGGKVASGAAYAALYKLAHAVTELCEETRIVPAPLPGKPHQM